MGGHGTDRTARDDDRYERDRARFGTRATLVVIEQCLIIIVRMANVAINRIHEELVRERRLRRHRELVGLAGLGALALANAPEVAVATVVELAADLVEGLGALL